MKKSDSIIALAKALSIVQSKLKPAIKNAENPFFKSAYADLEGVWSAVQHLLFENGLTVIQVGEVDNEGLPYLSTTLLHTSGEWVGGRFPLYTKNQDAQSLGSSITYMRRYALSAIVGIVTSDDDGNGASKGFAGNSPPPPQPMASMKAIQGYDDAPPVGQVTSFKPPNCSKCGNKTIVSKWAKGDFDYYYCMNCKNKMAREPQNENKNENNEGEILF